MSIFLFSFALWLRPLQTIADFFLLFFSHPCSSQVEPLWHAWLAYAVDTPPQKDPLMISSNARPWAVAEHRPNFTGTRSAYKPYSTTKPKINAWQPVAAPRQ